MQRWQSVILSIVFVPACLDGETEGLSLEPERPRSATIFFDDFNDGFAGWSTSGTVVQDSSPALVPDSARMTGTASLWRSVSTVGHSDIRLTWNMAATSLESGEYCYLEVDEGLGYSIVATLGNGEDDGVFRSGVINLGAGADDQPDLKIRFRAAAGATGDYCYAEDITVGDGGSGGGSRTVLTADELLLGPELAGPVDDIAGFALPVDALPPAHVFEGRLELLGEAVGGQFTKLRDDYNYDADAARLHLPEFDVAFVQDGQDLIPVQRGNVNTAHPYWTYIVEPGHVWQEDGDQGMTRASVPFALVQRNSNCTHNGTLTFLFDDVGVSKVHYQITQETCLYFKGNFWGLLDATYHPQAVAGKASVIADHQAEAAARFPTRPFAQLGVDYPGVNLAAFTANLSAEHLTRYGLVVDGTNYVSGCTTRFGEYAYCDGMRMPSYSTAKSIFAGMGMMALSHDYDPALGQAQISDWVPETAAAVGTWTGVSFDHALDMRTGNFSSSGYMTDEDSIGLTNEFFLAESYADKIDGALRFGSGAAPGSTWVYHTSDHFILARAMQNFLVSVAGPSADIYDYLVAQVLAPIGVGVGAHTSLRTSDNGWQGQPFGGYGMWLIADDIAKITNLLNVDDGFGGGAQLLDPAALAAAMQRDPADRGIATSHPSKPYWYNNGLWALEVHAECDYWVPFMSGYGGITVAMMPGGATFWYFSDNAEYSWADAVDEVHAHVANNCVGAPPPAGSHHVAAIDVAVVPAVGGWYQAATTVTIVDAGGVPVSAATVDGSYTGATSSSVSGVTNGMGQVTLLSGSKKFGGSWTLCVDAVSVNGSSYDAIGNVETCDAGTGP